MPPQSVLLADSNDVYRDGLASVFEKLGRGRFVVIGQASLATEVLELCRRKSPNVAVVGMELKDGSSVPIYAKIAEASPATLILALGEDAQHTKVVEALTAGAHGYLLKSTDPSKIIEAVSNISVAHPTLDAAAIAAVVETLRKGTSPRSSLTALSKQQLRVLALVAQGFTNKEIAHELRLSGNTIRNYLVPIFSKLAVKTRTAAAAVYHSQTASHSANH